MKRAIIIKGGSGSGNFEHAGRPGQVGGSASASVRSLSPKELLKDVKSKLGDLKKDLVFSASYVGSTMFGARLYFKPTTDPDKIKSVIGNALAYTNYTIDEFREHDLTYVGNAFYDDVTLVHIGPKAKGDWWISKHLRGMHDQSTHNPYGPGSSVHQLRAHGGFTYQPILKRSPTSGMALSLHPERELIINVDDLDVDTITNYIERNKDLLSDLTNNVGGWFDIESRKIFLDVSTVVNTREEAYKLAKQYKQEAFFDLGAMEEVRVGAHEPIVKARKPRYVLFEMPPNPTQAEIQTLVDEIKKLAHEANGG